MPKTKVYLLLGATLTCGLLALLFYGLFFASNPKEIPSALTGHGAAPFATVTFDGQPLKLEDFKGKPLVLNFWASWCVACRQEALLLEALHQKYTPKGAAFVGIAINDKREASLAFIARYGKTYILGPDNATGTISLDYGVTAVPETFLITPEGVIHKKIMGAVEAHEIQAFLDPYFKS